MANPPARTPRPRPVAAASAAALLKAPSEHAFNVALVLFGDEQFLKSEVLLLASRAVLGNEAADLALDRLDGGRIEELTEVLDRLLTNSMFNPRQIVVVDAADEFVSRFREGLERYLEHPNRRSLLVLDVKSWPSNTRLYAKVAQVGLAVACQRMAEAAVPAFLRDRARAAHRMELDAAAGRLLVELVGPDLGLLDQELAKLAAYCSASRSIDADAVSKLVGGWKAEVTWTMLDAVRDGNLSVALQLLNKLLVAGEPPLKLLGGASYVFRPIAQAVEISRRGVPLAEALATAGVRAASVGPVSAYLRRIGRARAERILKLLLQTDQALKGASSLPERTLLEQLFVQLAGVA
jgi:DNA polymerase-3 subunit delta